MPIVTRSGKKRMSGSGSDKSETPLSCISPESPKSPPPVKPKNEVVVIDLSDGSVSPPSNRLMSGTPLRPIFCVKNRDNLKEIEDREECFILEFDPDDDESDPVSSSDPTQSNDAGEASPEVSVLAEKGKVACRDYPHSRHLCIKFPFAKTPHESYCHMCFCYVCDALAPCLKWSDAGERHCDAIDNPAWKMHRQLVQLNKRSKAKA